MPHIHEKIDFTVNVYVIFKDKVLLRKHDKYGIWLPPGGHIDPDEDPNEAAVREVWEEAGLEVSLLDTRDEKIETEEYKELIPPISLNRHRIDPNHEHISLEYVALASDNIINPQLDGDRSDEYGWLSASEIEESDNLREGVKKDALKALRLANEHNR